MTAEKVYGIVAAVGGGRQLGEDQPEAFVDIAGRNVVERCLDGLAASHAIDQVLVTVSRGMQERAREVILERAGQWAPMSIHLVVGGVERSESVLAALEEIERLADREHSGDLSEVLVAVHDVTRCLTPPDITAAAVEAAEQGMENGAWTGVVPVLPVTDPVKAVSAAEGGPADGAEIIRSARSTPAGSGLRAAQTPQVFVADRLLAANHMQQAREELDSAHPTGEPPSAHAPITVTDDASLMEMAGETVAVVPGSPLGFAVTSPQDLAMARRCVAGSNPRR